MSKCSIKSKKYFGTKKVQIIRFYDNIVNRSNMYKEITSLFEYKNVIINEELTLEPEWKTDKPIQLFHVSTYTESFWVSLDDVDIILIQ